MNYKDYEYDTGYYDSCGNRIFKLQPTVVLLDSVAVLMPEKYAEEEEMSGQMSTTATAKANNGLFKRIIPMLKSGNIILFAINHVRKKVEINPFAHTKAQVAYLKPDEYLPGGDMAVYLANTLLRFDDSKLKPDVYGIDGSMVDIHLLKSRTNGAGKYATMVFNQAEGFDNDLSTFVLLKENDKIKGAGAYQYVDGHPEFKFTAKKFKALIQAEPEFRKIVSNTAFEVLSAKLEEEQYRESLEAEAKSNIGTDIYGMVMNMIPVSA